MPVPMVKPTRRERLLEIGSGFCRSGVALTVRGGAALAAWLPERAALAAGRLLGLGCWLVQPRRRAVVQHNLSALSSPRTTPAGSRGVYARFGESVVDTLRLSRAGQAALAARVRIEGVERLEGYAREGGAVLLAAHTGNWEWAGAALAARGLPVRSVARDSAAGAGMLLARLRARFGVRTAARLGELLADKSLGILAIFCDRRPARARVRGSSGVARGAMALASRRGAVALPALALRDGDGGYRVMLGPALRPGRSAAAREAAAREALEFLHRQLAAHPEQWFAFESLAPSARPATSSP